MGDQEQLSVKYYAAMALQKILLRHLILKDAIKPHLEPIIKCYLSIISQIDDEDIVEAFNNIMSIFQADLKPLAVQICNELG